MCLKKFKKLEVTDENEMYIEKLREVKEEEIGHPTLYGGMTPYTCGAETYIEETKMKNDITVEAENDITIEAKMKHIYGTTVRKELPDDITFEAEKAEMRHSLLRWIQYLRGYKEKKYQRKMPQWKLINY